MTPDETKRKYQGMLSNEILLSDPIGWMHDDSEFIVMTAVSSYKRNGCYAKVALCEVMKGVVPKMVSERAKGMRFIWELHDHLHKREHKLWTNKNSYENTLARVTQRCAELNAAVARLDYKFAIMKVLRDRYVWTWTMLNAREKNIIMYAEASRERGLPVEEAAEYMNFMAGHDCDE